MKKAANLALNRTATQSSVYPLTTYSQDVPPVPIVFNLSAWLAVDGSKISTMTTPACSQTNDGAAGPNWLMVDLGQLVSIAFVVLIGRSDCCSKLQ